MNKRELVIKTLELDETDIIPIHYLGIERSGTTFQAFGDSDEAEKYCTVIDDVGDITFQRFVNVDCYLSSPFNIRKDPKVESPPEHPNLILEPSGKLYKKVKKEKTGMEYGWYVDAYFRTKETLLEYWDRYGKPVNWLNPNEDYSAQKWENYVQKLSPYYYPLPTLFASMYTTTSTGIGYDRIAYYMRKDKQFMHYIFDEYCKANIEVIKGLSEAGADVCFYFDDLGQKDRGLISHKNFREFILPQYKKMINAAKKRGMFFIQHSCGNITEYLPDMVDAGLDCIQALEPASGVDLAQLKEDLGDKVAFMGGMDSSATLNFGTPDEIVADVKKCIKAAASGTGYFAGPSHDILDVPWENLLVFRDAIEKYRKYPLNF